MRMLRFSLIATLGLLATTASPTSLVAQSEGSATKLSPDEVTVVRDLVYATGSRADETTEWKLDVYFAGGGADAPMVLDVGGSSPPSPRELAERGVSVFVLEDLPDRWDDFTRSADPEAMRALVEPVACAVRFARGSVYGSETAPLVLIGFSGGGGPASHVALAGETFSRSWDEYRVNAGGPPVQVSCEAPEASTRVEAFVGIAGPYAAFVGYDGGPWDREFILRHEPELWELLHGQIGMHPDLRVRLFHGGSDEVIPYAHAAAFEAVLADTGYDIELTKFDGGHTMPPDSEVVHRP